MQDQVFRLRTIVMVVASICAAPQIASAEIVEGETVEVISTTPLPGIGLPIEQVPANVQVVKGEELQEQGSLSLADYMNNNLQGVSVNETQNNPYQPDILFRGFTASPLLGTPQGLSVFQDGVRVNEPFGDAVNWDLIPSNAIAGISLIPGSNPVFGLNTLGGSLSVTTKNGRTHQGGAVETSFGSWGRKTGSAEYGGVSKDGSIDYFISGSYFDEDGWRDFSPTEVKQLFGKVGWQNDTSRLELSYTGADNDMVGNGLIQEELARNLDRETINTRPDQTENTLSFLNLNGSHWFNDNTMLSANAYYRKSDRKTLNGDVNDDFDLDDFAAESGLAADLAVALQACRDIADGVYAGGGDEEEVAELACSGALNRSKTEQKGYGFNAQIAFSQPFMQMSNQLIVGAGYDHSRIKFTQSTEFGLLNATRGVDGLDLEGDESEVDLHGKTRSWGLFATDTLSLNDFWHLTLSGRYNHIKVENRDQLIPDVTDSESLSGDHSFNRFNPAVGVTFTPTRALTVYGSYNEGMRAPTSMELGCANPDEPCKLPNAMAGDPPLKKVVSKTFEVGARGDLVKDVKWTAAAYRTENHDDIHFIATNATNGMGYFDNVGKTRRMGIDTGLMGSFGKFSWAAGYSYVRATYETDLELVNEVNSSSDGDVIQVRKGDRLTNIPDHQFKLRMQYDVTPNWNIGTNIAMFSDVYVRGNENNDHDSNDGDDDHYQGDGKLGGYTVVNLDTRYKFGNSGWQVFAKAVNIFDKEYATGGMLGESFLDTAGNFTGEESASMLIMPGAPRAGWIGVRYEFGRPAKKSAAVDLD
jgi:outer membrane receptor protein involved in Fe transport